MMLFDALELQKSDNLLRRFEEIHNYLYANDGLSPEQALEEMIKLLFLKIADERAGGRHFAITDDEWGSLLATNKAEGLQERIGVLFDLVKQDFRDIFDASDKIKLSLTALGWAVRTLQPISLLDSSGDAKGLAFQKFLANRDKAGRGQFFTPEPVIDFCVNMIQPKPDEIILDPACGSGGFLLSALRHVQRTHPDVSAQEYIAQNLVGFDINTGIVRIAKMKLLLEANSGKGNEGGGVNIICTNSLETPVQSLIESSSPVVQKRGGFDIILANPPFGTTGKITNRQLLAEYELGRKWTQHDGAFHRSAEIVNGQVTEVLFVERCLALLRTGGRMAIVLPNGHFENSSLGYLRSYIRHHAEVLAVVNLPQETFIPFGTGVKTSLLFLEKRQHSAHSDHHIFFGKITKIGYHGNKNATPTYRKNTKGDTLKNADNTPIVDEDCSSIALSYHRFQEGLPPQESNVFTLPPATLNGRFDYDFYAPENRSLIERLQNRNAVRIAEIADIVREKSPKLAEPNATLEYIELSDINTHSFEIINATQYAVHELPSRASYQIQTGDILTAVAGNSIGTHNHATALVLPEHDGCICTNGFRVLRNPSIDPYYLLYFLKTDLFLRQVMMMRTGAAIPSVSDTDFANILVYLPENSVIASIGERIRKAFELREAARREVESITLSL